VNAARWWIYQRERFPLLAHGPLVLVFSASAVCYSALLRARDENWSRPDTIAFVVAFVVCLLFFLELRIADEFKDREADATYRPYRPVPRGLVTLRELAVLGVGLGLVQFALAAWLAPALVLVLLLAWIYFALMSREFFVREWIKGRHFTYLWTHMLVMPIVDLFATACDWITRTAPDGTLLPPRGLGWFLAASYFNGIVIEIGRKIRSADAEEVGVATYTAVWGRPKAVALWLGAAALTASCAMLAAREIGWTTGFAPVALALLAMIVIAAVRFLRQPTTRRGKAVELASGLWTLGLYLGIGVVPALVRELRA